MSVPAFYLTRLQFLAHIFGPYQSYNGSLSELLQDHGPGLHIRNIHSVLDDDISV